MKSELKLDHLQEDGQIVYLYADPKTGEWMETFVDLRRFRKHLV